MRKTCSICHVWINYEIDKHSNFITFFIQIQTTVLKWNVFFNVLLFIKKIYIYIKINRILPASKDCIHRRNILLVWSHDLKFLHKLLSNLFKLHIVVAYKIGWKTLYYISKTWDVQIQYITFNSILRLLPKT